MNEVKRQATETMDELHQTIPYCSYCAVMGWAAGDRDSARPG